MAGVVMAIASVQLLIVGYRLLPREIQPPVWRRAVLVLCALFYATFSALVIWSLLKPLFRHGLGR
jgi:multisubunit Na+/H+ antiporter MnhB subunit